MKSRMISISIATVASLLIVMLMPIIIAPVHALPADSMWVDPDIVTLDQNSIGTTFNATVLLNLTENVYAYQVGLHYNRTLLKCTRCGFTGGGTSIYFSGHTTTPAGPLIDTSALGNGSVEVGETLVGATDFIPGPSSESLVWIEFQVLNFTTYLPASGNFTTKIDITTESPNNNYVLDDSLNTINLSASDSTVTFIPEFAYLLLLPTFLALTLAAAIFSRRQQRTTRKFQ